MKIQTLREKLEVTKMNTPVITDTQVTKPVITETKMFAHMIKM